MNEPATQSFCPACGTEYSGHMRVCQRDGTPLKPLPPDPMIGMTLSGVYDVQALLGKGGISSVYKARNKRVGSTVAIKTLKQEFINDKELEARFVQEAQAVQHLTHPNIIAIHQYGVTPNKQPFLVMDFLQGELLADVIMNEGRVPIKRCLKIFIQVCDALQHCHKHKIIHRDLKPGNIMLVETATDTDVVKIFDFGFAKLLTPAGTGQQLTQKGDVLGTPLYMSPEQSRGQTLDSRSDIYSIGCVMYEAITGRAPFVGMNVLDTMQKQIFEQPERLDAVRPDLYIPETLTAALFRTLEKDPDKRYQNIGDFKRDLEIIYAGITGKGTLPTAALPGLQKLKQLPDDSLKKPEPSILILLGASGLVFLGIWLFTMMPRSKGVTAKIEHAIASNQSVQTTAHEESLARLRQSASQALKQGNLAEAEHLYQAALKEAQTKPGQNAVAAEIKSQLAEVYLQEEHMSDAQTCAQDALKLAQGAPDSPRVVAGVQVVLAKIALAREDYKGAKHSLEQALALQKKALGGEHEDVGTTLHLLGTACFQAGDAKSSIDYFKNALAVREKALGPSKPPVAATLEGYGAALKKAGKAADAQKLLTRAQTIRKAAKETAKDSAK